MNYLRIELNNIPEIVNYGIVHKLYEIAKEIPEPDEGEEDDVYLSGNLLTSYSYEGEADYLTTRCPNLHIITTAGYFITFEDQNLTKYLKAIGIGRNNDGNITKSQAAQVTTLPRPANNDIYLNISKFNELKYFTSITESSGGFSGSDLGVCQFSAWPSLLEIDISNFTSIGHAGYLASLDTFASCTKLQKVTTSDKLTKVGYHAFYCCSNLETIGTPKITIFGEGCFYKCSSLKHLDISNATIIMKDSFLNCSKILEFTTINCPNLTGTLESGSFCGCSQIERVINLGNITRIGVYSTSLSFYADPFYQCGLLRQVIVPETVTLIDAFLISAPSVDWVKLLCNTVPTVNMEVYGNFGESWSTAKDRTSTYKGKTYPIYVKDELYNNYISDGSFFLILAGLNRIKKLSEFETDFPNG